MKRIFFFIPLLFILCGCSTLTETPPQIQTAFSANAAVTIGEQKLTCTVTRIPQGAETISLVTPEALNGITYKWLDGKCTIIYGELEFQTDSLFLPDNTFVSCWIDLWQSIDTAVYETTENETARFSGTCKNGAFTVYVNAKNGLAERIVVPALDMEVKLSNAKIIETA